VPWERGYFSPYIEDVNDIGYPEGEGGPRKRELFEYVVDQLDTMVPNDLNIDMDNDGRVDGVTLIVCGPTDAWGDLLWPTSNSSGTPFHAINGKDVHSVILNFQQSLGISVICHEMGHQIGAPDFYHYHEWEPWHSIHPVSTWCLMASDRAQHWLTHNKWKYGHWFDAIPTLTATANPTTYTISSVNESPYSCYKIISAVPDQYYMVEYRKKAGLYEDNLDGSGLIVYRVTTGINGNAGGPPDEIYVYRPNGTLTENGQPGNAFFSQESGRTEIFNGSNPSPWLYADTLSTIAGDIVITNVGSSAGNSISFTISTIAPNTWTGEINESWTNAWNWTQGVPGPTEDVVIPSGCAHNPKLIGGSTASCKKLNLANGAILEIDAGTLNVHGTAHLSGQLKITGSSATVDFKGHTYSYSGSSMIDSAAGMLKFNGSWGVDSGCNINLDQSNVSFYGAEDAELRCDAVVYLKNVYVSKIYNKAVYYQSSLARLQVNGTFSLAAGGGFVQNADSDLQIAGSMLGSGFFRQEAGTLKAIGSTAQTISMSGSSYINNLWVNGSAQLNLQSALNIRGDVLISGTINAGGYAMTVWGNWTGTGT
jgi:M6 family metalloprotease-like protein